MHFKKSFMTRIGVGVIAINMLFFQAYFVEALEFSFALSLQYSYTEKKILSGTIELVVGEASPKVYQPENGHLLKFLSEDGRELYATRFEIPIGPSGIAGEKEWFDPKTGEQIYIPKPGESILPPGDNVAIVLNAPYLAEARRVEIFEPTGTLAFFLRIPSEDELISTFSEREAARTEKISTASREIDQSGKNSNTQFPSPKKPMNMLLVGGIGGLLIIIYIVAVVLYILRRRKQ